MSFLQILRRTEAGGLRLDKVKYSGSVGPTLIVRTSEPFSLAVRRCGAAECRHKEGCCNKSGPAWVTQASS